MSDPAHEAGWQHLEQVLREPPPEALQALQAEQLDQLATLIETARHQQQTQLKRALERALRHVPGLLHTGAVLAGVIDFFSCRRIWIHAGKDDCDQKAGKNRNDVSHGRFLALPLVSAFITHIFRSMDWAGLSSPENTR